MNNNATLSGQRNLISRISIMWVGALIYLGAIALAEVLITQLEPRVGLVLHGVLLLALMLNAALSGHIRTRRLLLALALVPLTRLLSLAMPLQPFPMTYWYLLVGVPLFIAALYTARIGTWSWSMLGITGRTLPFQLLIGLTGIGLGYLEYIILRPAPMVAELSLASIWMPALTLLIFTGLLEEFIFRGLLQSAAHCRLGQGGLVYVAVIFTVLHLGYRSWVDLAFVFAVAIFFGWVVHRTGSILGVSLAHGLTNIGLFLIFPFLLSPVQSGDNIISTVITTTIFTVTTASVAGSLALIGALFLLSLLIQKELVSSSSSPFMQRLGQILNIGVFPLLFTFLMIVIIKVFNAIN